MSPDYIKEWVRKAEADRKASLRAFHDSRRQKDQAEIACFHAQQCAEKYMKALLADKGISIPKIHDLLAIARKLGHPYFLTPTAKNALRCLNQYAVEIRYPGITAGLRDAQRAVRAMERIVNLSKTALS